MPDQSPEAYLKKVHDRETFLDFLASLEQDFVAGDEASKGDKYVYGLVQNGTGWYNGSIDA
ncbi:MAG: hypothetical protein HRT64_06335, partial [Erythrobacter sp.]|nr:hypothetical protein [Erythrobacter sp.]